uniref:Uncharacterized protein n=1 Tax=Mus spicilegus TaxID=10103 RepID=A0A8C6HDF3_MUSSI
MPSSGITSSSEAVSRRYDSRTTVLFPEAIGHAGTCLGILANDGVLLAVERCNSHKLLDGVGWVFVCLFVFFWKVAKLNEDMACSVAGTTPDAKVLTNSLLRGIYSSNRSQFHLTKNQEEGEGKSQQKGRGWKGEIDKIVDFITPERHQFC